jgi:hypothetical protein
MSCTEEHIRNAFTVLINDVQCLMNLGPTLMRMDIVMEKIDACKYKLLKACGENQETARPLVSSANGLELSKQAADARPAGMGKGRS